MSWFSKRRRNRQHSRRHVLDVKLSLEQRRSSQLRWISIAVGSAAAVFLVLYGCWRGGEWVLGRLIYQNPAFAVREIEVETDGVVALEQIRRWAGVNLDDNLFAIDLSRIKRDLEFVPVVKLAEVERALPHTLRLRISEREPVAQFIFAQSRPGALPEQVSYTLDDEGFVMPQVSLFQRAAPAPTNEFLPVITGVAPTDLRPGRKVDSVQVLAALKLIAAFERSPMAGLVDLREINVGTADILIVSTEQRAQVVFGLKNHETQLQRWRSIHQFGQQRGLQLAGLDLSVANNVPARWLDASEAALVKPKTIRAPRPKRRHV